jgi:hypothetical protein
VPVSPAIARRTSGADPAGLSDGDCVVAVGDVAAGGEGVSSAVVRNDGGETIASTTRTPMTSAETAAMANLICLRRRLRRCRLTRDSWLELLMLAHSRDRNGRPPSRESCRRR